MTISIINCSHGYLAVVSSSLYEMNSLQQQLAVLSNLRTHHSRTGVGLCVDVTALMVKVGALFMGISGSASFLVIFNIWYQLDDSSLVIYGG